MIELKDKGSFDVIVVGGGHAGIEASLISAKMGSKTAMITLDKKKIGAMHCNPSIGGSAKGIVVREIDALGGEMAKATDRTALQFKLLGTAGGPATQSLRVQSDKISYSDYMIFQVEKQNLLKIIEASVERIVIENDKTKGVITNEGNFYSSKAVIITTGTYLSPITFKGNEKKIEGPDGEKKVSSNISSQLKEIGFKFKRFKTGTSPRVLTNSINFKALTKEEGTNLPLRFSQDSDLTDLIKFNDQLPCYLTHTNRKTHDLIKENFHLSAIFAIPEMGVGPRYCPSIEDKVFRFSDKDKHQVFLEPESTKLDTTYIQGLSTSLPKDIQKKILQTIEGLENAEVKKWGYAIEYDVIETSQLNLNLETKKIKNLFTAGQINGTTGYEEAAAQGLVAGINACLNISGKAPLILGRDKSYIGVMIDDLVNKEVNDPYRLLTSRAEYRLLLRHDNSHTRLFPICKSLGLVSESL
jgi:tRNA uridine 5-carboxymethylaminomethyl modification enzyme